MSLSVRPVVHPWLAPAGALFGAGAAIRATLYRRGVLAQARLAGAVISVGNLSVGGSGKTPVVARLAEILSGAGLPVAILSRGYRGAYRGECLVVSDGQTVLAGAAEAGDEPVMLAHRLPGVVVAVGRRRDAVGRAVEARFGPRMHLLDDGYQHLRLARDLDILCLDALDLDDRPLPAGSLREFPSAAARADIVLLSHADEVPAERLDRLEVRLGHERTWRFARCVQGFVGLDGARRPAPARPFLLSGIARPERFHLDAHREAPVIAGTAVFADHHPFTSAEIAGVLERARAAGADAVVTTAKDAVRLPAVTSPLPFLVLRIAAVIADEARLGDRILAVARRAFPAERAGADGQEVDG